MTREQLDRALPVPMFVASVAVLLFAAGELHFMRPALFRPLFVACHVGLAVTWPLFLIEALLQVAAGNPRWKRHFACCLCPPLRLAARDAATGTRIWLPRLGWVSVNPDLASRVEQSLNLPMMGIALLVIPVLAFDYYQPDHHPIVSHVQTAMALPPTTGPTTETTNGTVANPEQSPIAVLARKPPVRFVTRIGEALIWAAFALEFVVMISIVDRKARYCLQHWVDLLVIVLPLVGFMRTLRLARLGRLHQLGRVTRLYRLRGSMLRAQRGMIVASFVDRVLHRTPQRQLARLRELLAEREREAERLRRQIRDLESKIDSADRRLEDAA